jgi:hypothetical protein
MSTLRTKFPVRERSALSVTPFATLYRLPDVAKTPRMLGTVRAHDFLNPLYRKMPLGATTYPRAGHDYMLPSRGD